MDRFEDNVVNELNNISEEDMNIFLENIDPSEFECSPELKLEIEDMVMSKTNLKKDNKNKRIAMFGKIAACAAIAISIGIVGTNDSVKASLAKMFASAPKKGVTEVAVDDKMLTLNQEDTKVTSADLELNLISAYTLDDKLTIEYQAVLKGTDLSQIEGILEPGANQNQLTYEYIVDKGYGKYFDFDGVDASDLKNIYTKPSSFIRINDTEYKGAVADVKYETEAVRDFTVRITEEYDVPKDVYKNIDSASFQLGEMTTTFTLAEAEVKETKEEAMEDGYIIEQDNIKLRLVPSWTSDYLYVETYVLSHGDEFSYLIGYDNTYPWSNESKKEDYLLNDYPGICLMADGKMIEPEADFMDVDEDNYDIFHSRIKFDLEGYENVKDFNLIVNGVCGVLSDVELDVPLDSVEPSDKEYDIFGAHLSYAHAYLIQDDPACPDFPMFDFETTQDKSDFVFCDFMINEPVGDNMHLSMACYAKDLHAEFPLVRE